MKHRLIYLLLLLPLHLHAEGLTLDGARQLAERYYAVLERAASQPEEPRIVFDNELVSIFGTDINGQSAADQFYIANDADAIFGSKSGIKQSIAVQDYITKLRNYAISSEIQLKHKILRCRHLKGPQMDIDKNDAPEFIEVKVKRIFYRNGKLVEELEESMKIRISNRFPFITNKYTDITPTSGDFDSRPWTSPQALLVEAYRLYEEKLYDEAFDKFEQVMELDSNNAEASYRLGVMIYKKQGCKHKYSSKKARNDAIYNYWQMSEKGRRAHLYYSDNRF